MYLTRDDVNDARKEAGIDATARFGKIRMIGKLDPDIKVLVNIPVIVLYIIVKQSLTRSGLSRENSSWKEAARYLRTAIIR